VDLGKLVSGMDLEKTKDVVDLVWDNKDRLSDLMDVLGDNKDNLIKLLGALPALLESVGGGVESAGQGALRAATVLVGEDAKGGATALLGQGASALDSCREQLADAASLLGKVSEELADIAVPDIDTKFTEVMGLKVISGVNVSKKPVFAGPAGRIGAGSTALSGVSTQLEALAGNMRELSEVLSGAGKELAGVGTQLSESGAKLRSLTG
jgi:hypothetical protein